MMKRYMKDGTGENTFLLLREVGSLICGEEVCVRLSYDVMEKLLLRFPIPLEVYKNVVRPVSRKRMKQIDDITGKSNQLAIQDFLNTFNFVVEKTMLRICCVFIVDEPRGETEYMMIKSEIERIKAEAA